MYNTIYFQPIKFSVSRASKDESCKQVDLEAFKSHQNEPKIPSMTELFQESGNYLPLFEETEIQSKCVLNSDILQLKDDFF